MAATVTPYSAASSRQNGGQPYALEATSLVLRYKKSGAPALDNFTLQVKKGEFFGLLGPNGAGKTTAISILSDRFPADSGSLSILGDDYAGQRNRIKEKLGLVPQEIALYDNLSARENLIFFCKLYGFSGAALRERIQRGLWFAGLTDQAARLVHTFSGGMKRRLNLAAGLLHDPQILFLDEPTVGIDTQSRHLIHEQLTRLNQEGMTILYTTHYMEEAQELCSRIGIMDKGAILKLGTPAELLDQSSHAGLESLFLSLTGRQLRDT